MGKDSLPICQAEANLLKWLANKSNCQKVKEKESNVCLFIYLPPVYAVGLAQNDKYRNALPFVPKSHNKSAALLPIKFAHPCYNMGYWDINPWPTKETIFTSASMKFPKINGLLKTPNK